jgi:RNA polymerase sigma factor
MDNLDLRIERLKNNFDALDFENLVKEYNPFIISIMSKRLNRYIKYESDPAYSVALSSFHNAIKTFFINKGHFINYASILIDNDLINYIKKEEKKVFYLDPTEDMEDKVSIEENVILKLEIEILENELKKFKINFDEIVNKRPKHKDSIKEAKKIASDTYNDKDFVAFLFKKRKLPVTQMSLKFRITRKVIYGSYKYIIAVIVVLEKRLDQIKNYL